MDFYRDPRNPVGPRPRGNARPGNEARTERLARPGPAGRAKLSGTFHADGERQFWNVNGFEDAVVIELRDEDYTRLIVSLDDPVGSAARINERAQAD